MSDMPKGSSLTDAEFVRLSSAVLAQIEAAADLLLQNDVIDIDPQRTGGLLELTFPDDSKIIVNTQPPLHELWLASRAGGYHFRFDGQHWVDTRDGGEFFATLAREASAQGGCAVSFAPA
jgi:CyaY protein